MIVDALADSVTKRGAELRLASPVQEITIGEPGAPALRVRDEPVEADAVVATVGLPIMSAVAAGVAARVHGLAGGDVVRGGMRGADSDPGAAFAVLLDEYRGPGPAVCRVDRAHELRGSGALWREAAAVCEQLPAAGA